MGNSHPRRRPLTDEEKARTGNSLLELLHEDVAVFIVAAGLLDAEVCALAQCSHSCLNHLRRYRFQSSVPIDRAMQLCASRQPACMFGSAQIVHVQHEQHLALIPSLPPSVHSVFVFEEALTSSPHLPSSLPPTLTSLRCVYKYFDATAVDDLPAKPSDVPRIHVYDSNLRILQLPIEAQRRGFSVIDIRFPLTLHTLKLHAPTFDEVTTLAGIQLPESLTDLCIGESISSPDGFPILPKKLQRLEVTINFSLSSLVHHRNLPAALVLPNSITDLNLTFEVYMDHPECIVDLLPSSLTSLLLINYFGSFPSERCPGSLTKLELREVRMDEKSLSIPSSVTTLAISTPPCWGASFCDLYLPDSVTRCRLSLIDGPHLDEIRWPAHLQELTLYVTRLRRPDREWSVPPTVTKLDISLGCPLLPHQIRFPPTLRFFILGRYQSNVKLKELARKLPNGIEELHLLEYVDRPLSEYDVPASLTSLTAPLHPGSKGIQNPRNLSRLVVTRCSPNAHISSMFPNLKELELQEHAVYQDMRLPASLRRLIVTHTFNVASLPPLPQSLREIVLRNQECVWKLRQHAGDVKLPEDCIIVARPQKILY